MPRPVIVIVAVALGLAGVVVAVTVFLGPRGGLPVPQLPGIPAAEAPTWAPPAEPPTPAEEPGRGIAGRVDADWLAETSARTGIPQRALAAYAGAALAKAQEMPHCGLSWANLAAIGAVESDHGRHDGSSIGPDGTATPPIYGVALDGDGTVAIPDSDGGELDGDAEHDRAMGPMQLIPQTWRNWHVDGGGDGVEDPQNIDDAALAAANYLCRAVGGMGLDFTTEEGWRAGIASYNAGESYLLRVADLAVRYGGS